MPALVVGLTGGVASGKSTVSDRFAKLGVPVLDADIAAREVVEPGSGGLRRLVECFGERILQADGRLDRRKLRDIVFGDARARRRLERILHPLIEQRLQRQLAAVTGPYAILVVPLLVGSELLRLVDRVLVVDAPVTLQRQRLIERDRCSVTQAQAIIDAQSSREQRLALADDVLINDGDPQRLEPRIDRLHRRYLALAADRPATGN